MDDIETIRGGVLSRQSSDCLGVSLVPVWNGIDSLHEVKVSIFVSECVIFGLDVSGWNAIPEHMG
jgi:hypothetical protein